MARGDVQSDLYIALGSGTQDIQPGSGDEYLVTGLYSEGSTSGAYLLGRSGGSTTGSLRAGPRGNNSNPDSRWGLAGWGLRPIKFIIDNTNFIQIIGDTAGIDVGYSAIETK